ncbi:sugar ABC transporter ATP-binding protein [Testudinibacter sp. TR-2022]|uniref:sugar ABC transporter ATP-binding protein n=5 Tax=Testudinibacter sp. TR-2022 TaxID=2585029 RepID=UPI001119D835|nr:sugar ABC transporter ATP-binding protein [Testudinibacter sp. TR-2022]TNH15357.1 sugar ABC transporter ATP-binding protein [Testudinibacter sp. TR-2022]
MKNTADYLLEVTGVRKAFGEVVALKRAEFILKRGSIHALCGGNGAGKSTFLSILMGFITPDSGHVFVNGKEQHFDNPKQALAAGITIVQQELSTIPDLSVAENIYLGNEPKKMGFVDFSQLNQQAQNLLDDLGFNDISPQAKMRDLSVAEQQLVEIAKALSHANADIIIMDEPTSAIGEEDVQKLFQSIRALAERGKGIIYVSHRLSEIFELADMFTIFRDGSYICEGAIQDITRERLIEHIIGGELSQEFAKFNIPSDDIVLEVNSLSWKNKLHQINFQLRQGEILGIYGLVGSGRSELLDIIFGLEQADQGSIYFQGQKLERHSVKKAINLGLAYVTEDRKASGLVLCRSVAENIDLSSLDQISRFHFINQLKSKTRTREMINKFNIKTPNEEQLVINLSGGNQQKVILGKWALLEPEILLLDEPTRGIDVGAKKEIYHFMSDFAQRGKSIIMVSSELSEIIGMSDRVIVLKNGKINGVLTRGELTQATLMNLSV